ncbi:MAG: NmrA family protein [Myxococcaceae bacterium]|nr:NmrA family protein [Myxococcaceae bacterium]
MRVVNRTPRRTMQGMKTNGPLLVTGASGHLGRRVVELLLASEQTKGRKIVATTRTPDKLADLAARGVEVRAASFDDAASLATAFRGVERALIVSTDALDRPGRRFEQHKVAVEAAQDAGVRHVVYTSLTHPDPDSPITLAPDHWNTEKAIKDFGFTYTFLRNNIYADYLLSGLAYAVRTGKLVNAFGTGAVGYVARDDCARAAAAALASSFDERAVLDITGPAAVTQTELAAIVTELTGRDVQYVPVDADTQKKNLVGAGLPPAVAELLVSFELAAAKGQLAVTSSAVLELTGTAPMSVRELLAANTAALLGGAS